MKSILLILSHCTLLVCGVVLGIYLLPVLTAKPGPSESLLQQHALDADYQTEFDRERLDSDFLHWGEGKVHISGNYVSLDGELAPGPDYQLYLVSEFVETEADFLALKPMAKHLGDVESFNDFMLPVPADVDVHRYNTVVVWCETFEQFITSAQYRF
ncbi:hypothetical protein DU002_16145 [Corallincola holothuriorum]|uniref:DM13 domain-containing protein n=1 Tax=Corallincola holothuriorum TaxID=2282215 RepID=A0A368N502_9GAMM|nr:DM13 domain-containing protein [Corallincola holothuriorum]RCU45250.1 hypothetical protein DU002_16145 [Corallincola holothuriorum]